MRKGFTSSVFILLLVIFSGAVLAGDKSACDSDKYPKKELQKLGVYGLCVAYYNADESARQGIAEKFEEQAGFEVPGTSTQLKDFYCPCWEELEFTDICDLGVPSTTSITNKDGKVDFGWIRFKHEFGTDAFATSNVECVHVAQDLDGNVVNKNDNNENALTGDEPFDCLSEIVEISTMYDTEFCQTEAP